MGTAWCVLCGRWICSVVMGEWVIFVRFRVRVRVVRGVLLLTSNVSCPRQILAILIRQEWALALVMLELWSFCLLAQWAAFSCVLVVGWFGVGTLLGRALKGSAKNLCFICSVDFLKKGVKSLGNLGFEAGQGLDLSSVPYGCLIKAGSSVLINRNHVKIIMFSRVGVNCSSVWTSSPWFWILLPALSKLSSMKLKSRWYKSSRLSPCRL